MKSKQLNSSESLAYTGEVTIKVKKDLSKKPYKLIKKKNSVTADFLDCLLKNMTGYGISANDRPMGIKLDVGSGTSESWIGPFQFSLDNNLTSVSPVTSTDTNIIKRSVTYTFLIPEIYITNKTIKGLKLISGENKDFAQIALDESLTISSNTNLEITWKIILSVAGTATNTTT